MPRDACAYALIVSLAFGTSQTHAQGAPPAKNTFEKPRARPAESLPSRVDVVPVDRYNELRDYVIHARAEGGTLFNAPDGQTTYMLVRRTKPSEVEEHSRWDDLIVVRSGAGSIDVGPRTKGAHFLSAGELRGGTITKLSRIELRAGDIVRIPAGVPHAFAPTGVEPWEFLLLKIRRPNKPLKRPPSTEK